MLTRSSSCRVKEPPGICTASPRCTAQTRTFTLKRACKSRSATPLRGEPGPTRNSTISTFPLEKKSTFMAEGKRRMREISAAAAISGFTERERPSSSRMKRVDLMYSGPRTRAMVCLAPSFLASRQQMMFTSSREVTAIIRSAVLTPASF